MRTVPPGAAGARQALRAGDRVRIVRHDGSALELFVTEVRDDAIAGELDLRGRDVRGISAVAPVVVVPLADVARVERVELSPGRTLAFAGVVAGAAAFLALISFTMQSWNDWGARPGPAAPAAPAR